MGRLQKCFSIASMIAPIIVLKPTKLTVSLASPLTDEIKVDRTVCSGHELLIPFTWNLHCSYIPSSLSVGSDPENNGNPDNITS